METKIGLKQGCPLSPILFQMYISDLETKLIETGKGIRIQKEGNFWDNHDKKFLSIPGLLFADDLVLLARNFKEMEKLLQTTSITGDELEIIFNQKKSAIVVYSNNKVGETIKLKLQGKEMPLAEEYKYLGIILSNRENILDTQEKKWVTMADKTEKQLHAQTIWGFDKFETTKVQWKAIAVPKLTYGNAVLTPAKRVRKILEKHQAKAGRWAIGVPNIKIANDFIEGELGWSSFETREAQSKIRFYHRVKNMEEHRWPKIILEMISKPNGSSKWHKRVMELMERYHCTQIQLETSDIGVKLQRKLEKEIKTKVTEEAENMWRKNMHYKKSLQLYGKYKTSKGLNRRLYDNSRESALLGLARAGMLNTRQHRRHREINIDNICIKCGMQPETTKHVVFECNDIYHSEREYAQVLGLTEDHRDEKVTGTKQVLRKWEKETSTIC
jgi:hypothetical protein